MQYVAKASSASAHYLVGFSMGANIALKLAGELRHSGPLQLASVMGICPPIDLALHAGDSKGLQ